MSPDSKARMLLPSPFGLLRLHGKDRDTLRFIYQIALLRHSLWTKVYSLRALCRITYQRSHLAVEADLTLRHVVSGAEPRRVPETSKTLAMRFPGSMPTQSNFSRKLPPHSCGLILSTTHEHCVFPRFRQIQCSAAHRYHKTDLCDTWHGQGGAERNAGLKKGRHPSGWRPGAIARTPADSTSSPPSPQQSQRTSTYMT